ncbi:MAG: hypothetical protein SXA11_06820 [Cyanobacteriota bacterium]|nr:hypothetical protein [Cyanobacteriota bacterium]
MTPQEFLAQALDITLQIQYKREQSETLLAEAKQLEKDLSGFSCSYLDFNAVDVVYTVYHDKKSGQLFLVDRCDEIGKVLFTPVEPANFTTSRIINDVDDVDDVDEEYEKYYVIDPGSHQTASYSHTKAYAIRHLSINNDYASNFGKLSSELTWEKAVVACLTEEH